MGQLANFITIIGLSLAALPLPGEAAVAQDAARRYGLPFPPGIDPETVCGEADDLQDVERYDGSLGVSRDYVSTHLASTVQLQWREEGAIMADLPNHSPGTVGGEPWCTGTLVSASAVLTAGHCFQPQDGLSGWTTPFAFDASGRTVFTPPAELAKLQVVHFGYQRNAATGGIRLPRTFAIQRLVEHVVDPAGLDYALVELAPDQDGKLPGDFVTPARLAVRDVVPGETLAIIQHPQGEPKKIGAGTAQDVAEPFIYYNDIDTWGASSGAGVRDDNGDVVGVHIRGDCAASANSGVSALAISEVSDAL